jgi:hypothetical protein
MDASQRRMNKADRELTREAKRLGIVPRKKQRG